MIAPKPNWTESWRGVEIRVFTTDEDSPLSLTDAASLLCQDEHVRAARFHFQQDRDRWMRSRALLRVCLAEKLQCPPDGLRFQTGGNGKPRLDPQVRGVDFNLSHSANFAAVAIGRGEVGVDIETWDARSAVQEVAELAFDPGEAAAIRQSAEPHRLFRRLWTAKEAVMKCCGQGLQISPGSIQLKWAGDTLIAAERTDFDPSDFPDWPRHFHMYSCEKPGLWTLAAAAEN